MVQGFGNVGSWIAREVARRGGSVIGASDGAGAVFDPAGLDIRALDAMVSEGLTVPQAGIGTEIDPAVLLTLDCDVLAPAALGSVITEDLARAIQAPIILEGANGPTTAEGDAILESAGVTVIPDVLANAGGVIGSYFEWHLNKTGGRWSLNTHDRELAGTLTEAYEGVRTAADRHGCSLRQAAFTVAVERVRIARRDRRHLTNERLHAVA